MSKKKGRLAGKNLESVMSGRAHAEELQKTVATREDLADFHPAHAIYVYAQNQVYFRRTLPDAPLQDRIAGYEHHMKFGPTRDYWTEFVFEAYVNHRTDVIFHAGLPDVPESRPHSRVSSR